MHILSLPALSDNYIWLLYDDAGQALVVDPGETEPVEAALFNRQLNLKAVLLTHHHADHTGGAQALSDRHTAPVYTPVDARIKAATHHVHDRDELMFESPALWFRVIATPGHTSSHVVYANNAVLLSGDTLFSLGCGRLFEGSAAQMLASLDRLAALPGNTKLCCGHEYTITNARFAATIEPENHMLAARANQVAALRAADRPSVPVKLSDERATNPFLRVDQPAVIDWCTRTGVNTNDRVSRFAALRQAKDAFKSGE